jgi:hypothetical protein
MVDLLRLIILTCISTCMVNCNQQQSKYVKQCIQPTVTGTRHHARDGIQSARHCTRSGGSAFVYDRSQQSCTVVRKGEFLHCDSVLQGPSNESYVSASNESYVSPSNESYVSASNKSYVLASNNSYVSTSNGSYISASNESYVSASNNSYISASNGSYISAGNESYVSVIIYLIFFNLYLIYI